MIEIFEIFWSSPIELRVIILACLLTPMKDFRALWFVVQQGLKIKRKH